MQFRIRCSACGKSQTTEPKQELSWAICTACGQRIEVPPTPSLKVVDAPADAADSEPQVTDDIIDIESTRRSDSTPYQAFSNKAANRRPTRRWVWAAAVAVLLLGTLLGFFAGRASQPVSAQSDTAGFAADEARNSDLLQLKSEAEALAVAGKLEEAHAKYRKMTSLAAGREFKGPLLWDILERAKVDQDRVYWILLARMDGAERAFGLDKPPPPGLPNQMGAPATLPSNAWASGRPVTSPSTRPTSPVVAAVAPVVPPLANTNHDAITPPTQPASAPTISLADAATNSATTQPQSGVEPVRAKVGEIPLAPVSAELAFTNPAVLDGGIDAALRRGTSYLLSQFNNGELPPETKEMEVHRRGLHALIAYSLLTTGQAVNDPRLRIGDPQMGVLLAKLKGYSIESGTSGPPRPVVYARSLRAAALSVWNRPEDRMVLKKDVDWLLDAHVVGGFTYDDGIKKWKQGPGRIQDAPPPPATQPQPPLIPPLEPRPGKRPLQMPGKRSAADQLFDGLPFYGSGVHASSGPLVDEYGNPIELADGGNHDARSGRGVGAIPPPRVGAPMRAAPPNEIYIPYRPKVVPPRVEVLPPGFGVDGNPMWDNSNSQIAVLGVASGAGAGIPVPAAFWKDVQKHWFDSQLKDGQWSYQWSDKVGSIGMTAGGTASLLTVNQLLQESGSKAYSKELVRAIQWLEQADNSVATPGPKTHYIGYDMFAVGRAGLLSGYKYFGSHDWYRELATTSLTLQNPDGSWGRMDGPVVDRVVDTAFQMLFLSRGRHPVMMNKLSWDGEWNRRPRDVANAAAYLSKVAERPMNWQVVKLERAGMEWLDAPILYIASDEAPKLGETDYDNIRKYVQSGGMLFLHADGASFPFGQWSQALCQKIAPDYKLVDVPPDHEIYSVLYKPSGDRKRLQMLSNGSRILALFSPYDLGGALQGGDERRDEASFQLVANIWAYANGRTNPRPRLDVYDIPTPSQKPAVTLPVVRLKYAGNWNPEPGSWARLSRYMQWETGAAVETTDTELSALPIGTAPLAHLTGTADFQPTEAELVALKKYVEAGGTLLIEACGGAEAFTKVVEQRVLPAFQGLSMQEAADDQAPITNTFDISDDLRERGVRPFVSERLGIQTGKLQMGTFGKGRVIYSPLDLSTGMAGSKSWGVAGYSPDYSIGVVKNVLLWTFAIPAK